MYTCHYLPNSDGSLPVSIKKLLEADINIGHNNCKYDKPMLEHAFNVKLPKQRDTLIIGKIMYSKEELISWDAANPDMPKDLWGSYSLKAWGIRFGDHKLNYDDWTKLSTDMIIYGKQDVDLTHRIYNFFKQQDNYPSEEVLDLEHEVAYIIAEQERFGFYLDIDKAKELANEMLFKKFSLEKKLQKMFKPKILPDGPIKETKGYKRTEYIPDPDYKIKGINLSPFEFQLGRYKNGKLKLPGKTKFKWFTSPHKPVTKFTKGQYQPVKLTKFEPGSRDKIRKWMKHDLGYEFPTYTEKGNSKVDADSLEGMDHPSGKMLKEYLKLVKDYSQLASGKGALIANYKEELHGVTSRVDTNGTVTGRYTSASINLNQIPAQKEFRELFIAPTYYEIPDELYNKVKEI